MNSETKFFTLEEISKKVGISKKTTHIQMQNIKKLIELNYARSVQIVINHQGYKLERNFTFSIQEIIIDILKEQLLFNLVISASKNENEKLKKFLEKNYVSLTQFYIYQKKLNEFLKKYDIVLLSNPYIHFKGEEHKIRFFLVDFYFEIFQGKEWPFETISQFEVQNIILSIENNMKNIIEIKKKKKLGYILAIFIMRIKIARIVEKVIDPSYKVYSVFYENFKYYINVFSEEFFKVKNVENEMFCFFHLSGIFEYMPLDYWKLEEKITSNSVSSAIDIIANMMDDLQFIFGKNISNLDIIKRNIFSVFLNQKYFGMPLENDFIEKRLNIPLEVIGKLNTYSRELSFFLDCNDRITQSEILTNRFLYLLYPLIDESFFKIKVRLYTMGTSYEYIMQKLELERREENISVYNNCENVDLIISDYCLDENYEIPVFIRSFPSTDNDWELLSNLVSKIKLNLKGVI